MTNYTVWRACLKEAFPELSSEQIGEMLMRARVGRMTEEEMDRMRSTLERIQAEEAAKGKTKFWDATHGGWVTITNDGVERSRP